MLLLRILFITFCICCAVFLVLAIASLDKILFAIAFLFAIASGLVVWEGKQRFQGLFRS